MERLTQKLQMIDGTERVSFCFDEDFAKTAQALADKLAHYEELEEQGRLVKLPCKVGDTVYVIEDECKANEPECIYDSCNDCPYCTTYTVSEYKATPSFMFNLLDEKYKYYNLGVNVFLTKPEAEKALAEMGV